MRRTYKIHHHNFELTEHDEEKIKNIIDTFKFFETPCHISCRINYYNESFITKIRLSAPGGRLIISRSNDTDLITSSENALKQCFQEFNIYVNNKLSRTSHIHGITSSKVVKL